MQREMLLKSIFGIFEKETWVVTVYCLNIGYMDLSVNAQAQTRIEFIPATKTKPKHGANKKLK